MGRAAGCAARDRAIDAGGHAGHAAECGPARLAAGRERAQQAHPEHAGRVFGDERLRRCIGLQQRELLASRIAKHPEAERVLAAFHALEDEAE